MVWTIEFDETAKKSLKKLDKQVALRITRFMRERIASLENPRSIGEALQGKAFDSLWKYRVGDWRIIASIEDQAVRVLVVRIGNRRDVYKH